MIGASRYRIVLALLSAVTAALFVLSLVTGPAGIGFSDALASLYSGGDQGAGLIMREIRLPRAILGLMIVCTFLVAGFHKFNYDFISPQVSCIRVFAGTIWQALTSDFLDLGIRTIAILGLILAAAFAKGRWMLMDFLKLRGVPAGWQALFLCWLGLVTVIPWATAALPLLRG